jgi:N-acetylmuramoyl-L-alanine amidase
MAGYVKLAPKITGVLNIGPEQADNVHGRADKDMIVLHETVSPDYPGWKDVISISEYLDNKDYGIHSVIDLEGHIAWAWGQGNAIFYHTASSGRYGNGRVNTRAIGIELISRVMLVDPDNTDRWRIWWERNKQIDATAKVLAWASRIHKIPLVYSNGKVPGVTAHWQVSKTFGVSGGHVDCWPRHMGGYFPILRIIERAKYLRARGY